MEPHTRGTRPLLDGQRTAQEAQEIPERGNRGSPSGSRGPPRPAQQDRSRRRGGQSASLRAARLEEALRQCEQQAQELSDQWDEIQRLRDEVQHRRTASDAVTARRDRVAKDQQRRRELIAALEARAKDLSELESEAERAAPALAAAIRHSEKADIARDEARTALKAAEADQRLANADRDHHRKLIEKDQLQERLDRLLGAERVLKEAETHLELVKVSDKLLQQIEDAHIDVVRAEARADSAAASVEATALRDVSVRIDGRSVALSADASERIVVNDQVELVVGDLASIRVQAGSGSRDLAVERDAARAEFQRLCEKCGVADLKEAQAANEERRTAERGIEDALKAISENLRDLTVKTLRRKVEGLSEGTAGYEEHRPAIAAGDDGVNRHRPVTAAGGAAGPQDGGLPGGAAASGSAVSAEPEPEPLPPLPPDFETARRIARSNESIVAERRAECTERENAASRAAHTLKHEQLEEATVNARIDSARSAEQLASDILSAARKEQTDTDIVAALAMAAHEAENAVQSLGLAESALEAADPDSVEAKLENARDVVNRTAEDLRNTKARRNDLRISLEIRGEEGLHTRRDETVSRLRHLERGLAREESRAQAALLLHDTFAGHRQQARQRYVKPFKDRVEQLGRIVFGPTFEVDLDGDLRIVRRTLDNTTLHADQLSTGAQEQLSVLGRLACAAIVNQSGDGAPVMIDDALGWSDPERLKDMGTAIAAAGRQCQIVVLTCTPRRYSHIGNARVISLAH